jgi:hypothetical protein
VLLSVALFACGRTELDLPVVVGGAGGFPGHSAGAAGGSQVGGAGAGGLTGGAGFNGGAGGSDEAGSSGGGTLGSATPDGGLMASANRDAATEGPTGPGHVLYTSCATLGAMDCSSQDPSIRLLCDGMTWNPVAKCGAGMVCDTQPGPDRGLCTASDAGTSAQVGGNSPPGVVLYTPCPGLGALDCSIANPKVQVLCDGMLWGPIGECSGQLVCDSAPGPDQGLCKSP